MPALLRKAFLLLVGSGLLSQVAAQQTYTWEEVQVRFRASNPSLHASQLSIDEARAQEITAYLRPNPDLGLLVDQFTFTPSPYYRPFSALIQVASLTYLHERQHKRELRRESAQKNTAITSAQTADMERMLLFNLRTAFVQALQARAVLANARENLQYYDRSLELNRERLKAGDIAEVDLDRLELQRVQFEADLENSTVSLRNAKIQLLTLLNDRTPVDRFDISGPFDFAPLLPSLDELRNTAVANRPDLRSACAICRKGAGGSSPGKCQRHC